MKFAIMKLFRRSKAKQTQFNYDRDPRFQKDASYNGNGYSNGYNNYTGGNMVFAPWLELPTPILQRIFAFICPHTQDESYETCEQSVIEDACMLCDLRDLAHASMACKQWRKAALPIMYHSIRIDSVHYCEREVYLSEKRKRRSRFDRNGVPEDTASARLSLLCRTLREDPTRLGKMVQYFKTPYMLRESKASDLARTIAVLPNLRHVDLPEGLFVGDPAYSTLRLEVQARCPELKKMSYMAGSERSLEALRSGTLWTKLEVLELGQVNMDPAILRQILSVLRYLRALKVSESRVVDDDIFKHNDVLPAVPALEELILKETPRVTSNGLVAYLSRPDVQSSLKVLSLTRTGVHPQNLQDILGTAPKLQTLSIVDQVDSALPSLSSPMVPLANLSLRTLRYEITASPSANSYTGMIQGYYDYLAQSLFAGGFPRLTALYVRDLNFPDILLGLPPPPTGFPGGCPPRPSSSGSIGMFSMGSSSGGSMSPNSAGTFPRSGGQARFSSNNPFANNTNPFASAQHLGAEGNRLGPPAGLLSLNQTLEVFTKGGEDDGWGIVKMDPINYSGIGSARKSNHARTGSSNRPLSSYGLTELGAGWNQGTAGARKSIIVGNGSGGFLAVPGESAAPTVGGGYARRGSQSQVPDRPSVRPDSSAGKDRDLWR